MPEKNREMEGRGTSKKMTECPDCLKDVHPTIQVTIDGFRAVCDSCGYIGDEGLTKMHAMERWKETSKKELQAMSRLL